MVDHAAYSEICVTCLLPDPSWTTDLNLAGRRSHTSGNVSYGEKMRGWQPLADAFRATARAPRKLFELRLGLRATDGEHAAFFKSRHQSPLLPSREALKIASKKLPLTGTA